jgi:transposase-like protein
MSKFRKKHRYYSEIFKKQVVDRVMSCEMSVPEATQHYGIGGSMTIYRWLDKYAPEWRDIPEEELLIESLNSMAKKEKSPREELAAEVKSLKRLLDAERLRSEAFLMMIKLAEEKYGIPIEKKSGAKQ